MNLRYEITTSELLDGRVLQKVDLVEGSIHQNIINQVVDLRDLQIREILVKMGWTPPSQVADHIENNGDANHQSR